MENLYGLRVILYILLAFTFQVQAQDPCIEAGYELSFAVENIDCKGADSGVITVNSTGCECFFSDCIMTWSNGDSFHTADSLTAGIYTVVVEHPNGCILEQSVEVFENESFIADVIVNPIRCNGENNGSIEIIQAELTGALAITWSTGTIDDYELENLGPGVYEFTAENYLGCQEVHSFEITEPNPLSFETEVKMTCEGMDNGEIKISPEGGTEPYVLFLNSELPTDNFDLEALNPGTYELLVVDGNNCESSKTIEIEEEIIPVPEVLASDTEICAGSSVELEALIEDLDCTYQWTPEEGLDDPTSASVIASPESTTTYTVVATSPSGCASSYDITLTVEACASGLADAFENLSVFPNPSTGIFNMRYDESITEISVYDVVGRRIQLHQPVMNQQKVEVIDINEHTEGIYFLVLTNEVGSQRTVKITKE